MMSALSAIVMKQLNGQVHKWQTTDAQEGSRVGARANNVWQYSKHSFRKFDKFVEI